MGAKNILAEASVAHELGLDCQSGSHLIREVRWLFAPSSCPVAPLLLGAIVISCSSFIAGAVVACCFLSARCRYWIWHCISGLNLVWGERQPVPDYLVPRDRFREYRRAWACAGLAALESVLACAGFGHWSAGAEVPLPQLLWCWIWVGLPILNLEGLSLLHWNFHVPIWLLWSFRLILCILYWLPNLREL